MPVLDDDGDLFGVVNVVDALVVLFVLAAVVGGAALVLGQDSSPPPTATTNVTLDIGAQPTYIVAAINEGDTHSGGPNSRLTITDVHLTPQGDRTRVIVRARLDGLRAGGGIRYADAPPRLGRSLTIATNRYEVSGQIRAVGRGDSLAVDETAVVIRDRIAAVDARELAAGDEVRLAGRTVATVEDVAAYATGDPNERVVFVEATLRTHRQQGERRFGGVPVRRGQTVTLGRQAYTLDGRIERVGGGLERGNADILLEDVVDIETATRITRGDVASVAGHDTAEVVGVTSYATQNPDRRRIFVGLSLNTLAYDERERFGTTPVQRGNAVTFATDDYELSGPIDRVGATEPRGAPGTRTVTLRMSDVRADMADAIQPGMSERASGQTVARITQVGVEPSLIITTGENGSVNVVDHPINREVTITAELQVRETTTGVRFKGQTVRQGSTVVLDLGTITVEATVVSIGA